MTDTEFIALVAYLEMHVKDSQKACESYSESRRAMEAAEKRVTEAETNQRNAWMRVTAAIRERAGVSETDAVYSMFVGSGIR